MWLGIHKLLSYFGIGKDPSEKLSKGPTTFNKFHNYLREGKKGKNKKLKDLETLLKENSKKLKDLKEEIGKLKPGEELPINRSEVLDFTEKLKEIDNFLKQILGKE